MSIRVIHSQRKDTGKLELLVGSGDKISNLSSYNEIHQFFDDDTKIIFENLIIDDVYFTILVNLKNVLFINCFFLNSENCYNPEVGYLNCVFVEE